MLAIEETTKKLFETFFVSFVRRKPARLLFAFASSFDSIALHPFDKTLILYC